MSRKIYLVLTSLELRIGILKPYRSPICQFPRERISERRKHDMTTAHRGIRFGHRKLRHRRWTSWKPPVISNARARRDTNSEHHVTYNTNFLLDA
ncbi:hypothetical protein J6590_019202 [Homalodisca vitripennis]|nr:hypothetical protein J6590_019202 [Homalodisca vitripennis]